MIASKNSCTEDTVLSINNNMSSKNVVDGWIAREGAKEEVGLLEIVGL